MPVHIPWDQVILHGPKVLDAATALWNKWNSRQKPEAINSDARIEVQTAELAQRLQSLEEAQAANAALVKDMAEQIQGISAGLSELSRKTSIALWLACGALLTSAAALILVLLR